MRKVATVLVALLLALSIVPAVLSVDIGAGTGINMETEKFAPLVWMCDHRIVTDDKVEPGRINLCGDHDYQSTHEEECKDILVERIENYAFEGEQIQWKVLVMDKNGVEKIKDVYVTVGSTVGAGNPIEANCKLDSTFFDGKDRGHDKDDIPDSCNARILEEKITEFNPEDMAYFTCTFTVEPVDSMSGQNWITVEAEDLDGLTGHMAENEYWFLNPEIGLTIDGTIDFGTVRPGAVSYSDTITVGNDAAEGSGVLMDMFVSGTDFYDPMSSGAKCPTTNQLSLDNFRYYATNGNYGTQNFPIDGHFCIDKEGYSSIPHGDRITQAKEIIGCRDYNDGFLYQPGNVLSPGAEMSLTFKLALPEPCNGDFSDGNIFFYGEAV